MFGCVACGWIDIRILLLHCRCNAYEVDGKCLTRIIIKSGLDKRFQTKRGGEWENEAIRKGDSHCCPPESWCPIRELLCSLHIPDDIPSLGISSSQSFGVSSASWLSNHPGHRTLLRPGGVLYRIQRGSLFIRDTWPSSHGIHPEPVHPSLRWGSLHPAEGHS